ncbi:hypothetical protein ACI65C_003972 [Semiaphis heraclei]
MSFNSNLLNSSNLGNDSVSRLDIRNFVNLPCTVVIDDKTKHELLTNIWTPEIKYSFKEDSTSVSRCFRNEWLSTYSPWLSYSQKMKGPFCVFCVLFHSSSGHAAKETDTHEMELHEDSDSTSDESHGETDTGMHKN